MIVPRLFIVIPLLAAAISARGATYRAALTTDWTENFSRSAAARDLTDVLTLRAAGTASVSRQFAGNLTASAEAEAAVRAAPEFSQLTLGELTLRTEARRKFGLGPLAPILAGTVAISGRSSGTEEENGFATQFTLSGSKRLIESVRFTATAEASNHFARSAIFDTSTRRYFGELAWDITDRWQLSGGYGRFRGTFTANASGFVWNLALTGQLGRPIQQYYTGIPWGKTDMFGDGWVSYRVHGTGRFWWLQLSPALSDATSVTLRYENTFATNIVSVKYRMNSWSAALVHRF